MESMNKLGSTWDTEAYNRRRRASVIATAGGGLRALWLLPLDLAFLVFGLRYGWLKWLFTHAPPRFLAFMGRIRAERAAHRAIRRVPAYRRFLEEASVHGEEKLPFGILGILPETDKRSYIDKYSLEDRCVDGQFTFRGTMIDESSGSTGTPYNWIRSSRERSIAHRNIGFFARYAFGSGPLGHDQCVLDGRLGGRLQHEPGHEQARPGQVDGPRSGQDLLDASPPWTALPLSDRWLPAVCEASARCCRARRLRPRWLRASRPRRRRRHERRTARLPARSVRVGVFRLWRDGHRDRHGRRVAGQHRSAPAGPRQAGCSRSAVRARPATADGLPVQPADSLARGQRRA